ncbi:11309_t:CDS:2 [Entrophospora sp. SA101]|nr:5371_t:CDS:2 [Entrophospora sp. SA101]CAJ0848305.1 11309_t:CDS:2 [Entrophospora sp. SA101]
MSQITTYSLEPGMGLDKLKKDDIKKLLDQRDLNYDEKNNQSDSVVLLRTNIEFETDNKIEEAKKRMDLDVIMDDEDDMDNLQSRKKKRAYLL